VRQIVYQPEANSAGVAMGLDAEILAPANEMQVA
jgi:hypothetical protein